MSSNTRNKSNERFSRRQVLKAGLGVGALAAAAQGCSSLGGGNDRCAGGPTPVTPAPEGSSAAAAQRMLAGIDTIVVVMMENRSFDHLYGSLCADSSYPCAGSIDGLKGHETNPDSLGRQVPLSLFSGGKLNPKHDWDSCHLSFNDGRLDGFVRASAGENAEEVMSYHRRETAPFLYAMADQYTVCDRWFSSVMGPTWPNRYYLHAGTAAGRKSNLPMGLSPPPTVWHRMADRCYTAKNYFASSVPWYSVTFPANSFSGDDPNTPVPLDHFYTDAQRGELPNFAIIDPDFWVSDGAPPHDLGLAEAFLGSIYRAMVAGPQWSRSLLVVMFDEHGGFYDHVMPPLVNDPDPDFRRIGFRVPALVIGPTVRQGAVISTPFEHTSVLSTLASRYGIASLGPRMDAAADLSVCLDPERALLASESPRLPPAVELHASVIRNAPLLGTSQPDLEDLAKAGGVPQHHVDTRSHDERVTAWLRRAQELEAVKVIG